MKKKIFSILFALVLVLSFSLVTAVPAGAQTPLNVIPFTVNDDDSVSTATWDTTEKNSGISSVKLVNPDVTVADNFAEVFFGVNIALGDITLATTSFYCKSTAGDYIPYFIFEIPGDYAGDGILLRISNDAAPSTGFQADWAEFFASDAIGPWLWEIVDAGWSVVDSGTNTWAELVTSYGTEIVNCVVVELSAITVAATSSHTAYVDDVTISGTTYDLEGTATDYTTIQAAIDAAATGDTISVAAGTYNTGSGESFPITLGKSVTLKSVTGDYRTSGVTLDGQIVSSGTANNITIQGINFVVDDSLEHGFCIWFSHMGNDMSILSNSFTASPAVDPTAVSWPAIGLLPGVTHTGLVLDDNLFTGVRGIFVSSHGAAAVSDVTITNNTVNGDSTSPAWAGISVDTVSGNISDNVISYTYDAGINVAYSSDLTISGNTVTHAGRAEWGNAGAINLYSDCTNIAITGNTLSDSWDGITIKDMGALGSGIAANLNNITGNSNYGILNSAASGTLDAENNWWGNASGPQPDGAVYTSYGDAVSTLVTYNPWLLEVVDIEEVASGILPETYDKTLALKDKWTLVSTDKEVTANTTWVGTTALSDSATILPIKYTPADGYTQVILATQLTPVDAFYVKTDGGGGVGIDYSTDAPGVVTKPLGAGWNIISCAGETDAYTLLSQLRYALIGQEEGVGLTNLIGQGGYNQFTGDISKTLVTDNEWLAITPAYTQVTLNAFDGYWVQMNADKSFGVIP